MKISDRQPLIASKTKKLVTVDPGIDDTSTSSSTISSDDIIISDASMSSVTVPPRKTEGKTIYFNPMTEEQQREFCAEWGYVYRKGVRIIFL